jgi:AcrR family transcriptional regulator
MTLDAAPAGLRERKRAATRRAIEVAALEIVAERGLEKTTVDEISHRADISPRTFFNYFNSKEVALVGEPIGFDENDEAVRDYIDGVSGANALHDLGTFISRSVETNSEDFELQQMRRSVLKQYPELFQLRMAAMRNFEDQVGAVVARRLHNEDPSVAVDDQALVSRARLITLVAFGAIKHAWTCWAQLDAESGAPLTARLRESFDQLNGILESAKAA